MKTAFSINNFRVFDQEEMMVRLRPITILTGCNNSGKSSITKALCLMKAFCRQIDHDLEADNELRLEQYKLDFHKYPNDILGSFDLVRHHKKSKKEDDSTNQRVVYEFIVHSYWLLQDVIIHMEFDSMENDDLNDGYLQLFYIKTMDDKTIYKAALGEDSYTDFSSVKLHFLYFLYGQRLFSRMQDRFHQNEAYGEYIDLSDEPEIKEFDEIIDNLYHKLGVTAYVNLHVWQIYHSLSKKITPRPDSSFAINSTALGVYCYFPCLYDFKDVAKSEIRQKVNDLIASQAEPLPSLEQKIIELFLDTFEASGSQTLHEFMSQEEDKQLFHYTMPIFFNEHSFSFPESFQKSLVNTIIDDESDLPSEANWEVVIRAMDTINQMSDSSQKTLIYANKVYGSIEYEYENNIFGYFRAALEDIFSNIMPGKFYYSPTALIHPKRLFSLENTDDFSMLLKNFFDAKKAFYNTAPKYYRMGTYTDKTDKYQPCSFINKWMQSLGIAQRVEIKTHADGYGATVRLYDKNDRKGMLLADKGLGGLHVFTLLLKIETAILEQKVDERLFDCNTSGIGEKLVKLLPTYNQLNPITLAIEEPEVHLHPNHQSILADMIVEAYQKYGIQFIIETHSEYLIRKLQVLVADKKCPITHNNISLNYVEREESGRSKVRQIDILEDGQLSEPLGTGFLDEAGNRAMDLLLLKVQK